MGKKYSYKCEICGNDFIGNFHQKTCSRKCGATLRIKYGIHSNPIVLDISKEELINLYQNKNMTLIEISDYKKLTYKHVLNLFRHYGIKRRIASKRHQLEEDNSSWKGGKTMKKGYIYLRCVGHPNASKVGHYVKESHLIMEKHLGRYLTDSEVIHHINGDTTDDRLENLKLMPKSGDESHCSHHNRFRGKVMS